MDYLQVANHPIIFWLSLLVIVVVVIQSLLFVRKGYKRGLELQVEKKTLNTAITNSILLSIVPSLPIIVMMLALSVPLGRYFPWLRLSIVGSAVYEGTAANVAAQSMGLADISSPGMTPRIFIIVMFVMTIGIIWGIVFNIIFMPTLDKYMKRAKANSTSGFLNIFSSTAFAALLIVLSVPYVSNFENLSPIIAFATAGIVVLLCNKLADVMKAKTLRDFSLPIAMIAGMAAVIVQVYFF